MSNPIHPLPEWAKQQAVFLVWPDKHTDWAADLQAARACYLGLIEAITQTTDVLLLINPDFQTQQITQKFSVNAKARTQFIPMNYNDTWIRDYGPIAVKNTLTQETKNKLFRFNGWGNKFAHDLDDAVALKLQTKLGFQGESVDFILEGGSIDCNSAGHCLTTKQCLLNHNRGDRSQTDIEMTLRETLGIQQIHWLDVEPLPGDDTNAHIDTLARFVDENTIVYCAHETDKNLKHLEDQIRNITRDFPAFKAHPLPTPLDLKDKAGNPLPTSYANFLITNDQLILPTYGHPFDEVAIQTFKNICPQYTITPLPARTLTQQGGSIHCATMPLFA